VIFHEARMLPVLKSREARMLASCPQVTQVEITKSRQSQRLISTLRGVLLAEGGSFNVVYTEDLNLARRVVSKDREAVNSFFDAYFGRLYVQLIGT
jgi:hypothetical protein